MADYYERKAQQVDELRATYNHPNWYKRWFYANRSRTVLEALDPHVRDFVLDVGSGPGYYGRLLNSRGVRAVSVDLSASYLRQGSEGANGAESVRGDAGSLPFKDNSFSKVLATEVIEHCTDPNRVIAEIARVLRPRGVGVITSPSAESYMDKLYGLKRSIFGFEFNEHLWEFTPATFLSMIRRHLLVSHISYANFLVPFPFDLAARRLPSAFQRCFEAIESMLKNGRGGPRFGWTIVARCEKPGKDE